MSDVPDDGLQSGLAAVQSALEETGAVGFLYVSSRDTPNRRYLTRHRGVDRETAVVFLPATAGGRPQALYCVPTDSTTAFEAFSQVADGIDRTVVGRLSSTATGQHICDVLADRLGEQAGAGTLLVPRNLPHDTAIFLQQAGYELQSTAVVDAARAITTPAERDCLEAVQQAAVAAMDRIETVLANCVRTDSGLSFEGRPLTIEGLRRRINSELVSNGVSPAANTRIETTTVGSNNRLAAGEPICIQLAPRGPDGYHGHLVRTLVVDSEGGWERRAHVAVEAGLRAAARHIEPGVEIGDVEGEVVAEIGAYGFPVARSTESNSQIRATATVYGIGLSRYERPMPGTDSSLRAGMVIAVSAGITDATRGTVRVGSVRILTAEGSRRLTASPLSLLPTNKRVDSTS